VSRRAQFRRFFRAAKRVKARSDEHFLALVAAGVAFYGFLALVPTTVVAISLYGVFADPAEIEQQLAARAGGVPDEVRRVILAQVRTTAAGGSPTRGAAVVVGLALALWTASAGMNGLVRGIDIAHGRSPRHFVEQRGLSLALTLGAVAMLVLVALLAIGLPSMLGTSHLASGGRWLVDGLRWPLLALLMAVALAALYRVVGGGHGRLHLRAGPAVGAVLWIAGSAGFAFYTSNFARYSRTYGSLAGIAVVLLWLYLGAVAVLVGAEVDADHAERH
jgi:membrane protein